jgi:LuxR family maltose regulon positive regulatory protein
LHRTAAAWFAEQELPALAFDHLMHTDEGAMTVELLHSHAPTVLFSGDDRRVVRGALTKVGADVVAGDPRLGLISALAHLAEGEYSRSEQDLSRASAAWPADPDPGLLRMNRLVLTTKAMVEGRPPPPVTVDWEAVLAAHEGTELEAWTRLALGWTHLCAGRETEARRELETAERLAGDRGYDRLTVDCLSALGTLAGRNGDFTTMETLAETGLRLAAAHGWTSSRWLSADHLMVGFAQFLQLNPVGALEQARHAAAALTPETDSAVLRYATGVLTGAAYLDTGRRQEGLALVQQARRDHGTATVPAPLLAAAP